MNLHIEHYPAVGFVGPITSIPWFIDIHEAVKGKLKEGEQLINATALKIFKQIKWKSDVYGFLTKPVVLISLSAAILTIGVAIRSVTERGPAYVAGVIVSALGAGLLGFVVQNTYNGFFSKLSEAYRDQSNKAKEYIGQIEAAKDQPMTFTFA